MHADLYPCIDSVNSWLTSPTATKSMAKESGRTLLRRYPNGHQFGIECNVRLSRHFSNSQIADNPSAPISRDAPPESLHSAALETRLIRQGIAGSGRLRSEQGPLQIVSEEARPEQRTNSPLHPAACSHWSWAHSRSWDSARLIRRRSQGFCLTSTELHRRHSDGQMDVCRAASRAEHQVHSHAWLRRMISEYAIRARRTPISYNYIRSILNTMSVIEPHITFFTTKSLFGLCSLSPVITYPDSGFYNVLFNRSPP